MQLQPEKDRAWELLDSLNHQLVEVQNKMSNVEFELFVYNQRLAKEDEANAQADMDRQRGWLEEAQADVEALEEERDALKQADGTIDAGDQAEYDRLDGEVETAKGNRDDIQSGIDDLQAAYDAKKQEQIQQEQDRAEAAEREQREKELEENARAAKDRKREEEDARRNLKDFKKEAGQNNQEIENLYDQQNQTTDAKVY